MIWQLSHRGDPAAARIADRHYNRQKPGTAQFVPPGSCCVFLSIDHKALWVTSWPLPEYVKHAWSGAWVNSCFRNEGAGLSSELITEAVQATRWYYGEAPEIGIISFIDPTKVRRKRDPGRCYRKAGWLRVGTTKGGLSCYQQKPADMPEPHAPAGVTLNLPFSELPEVLV